MRKELKKAKEAMLAFNTWSEEMAKRVETEFPQFYFIKEKRSEMEVGISDETFNLFYTDCWDAFIDGGIYKAMEYYFTLFQKIYKEYNLKYEEFLSYMTKDAIEVINYWHCL